MHTSDLVPVSLVSLFTVRVLDFGIKFNRVLVTHANKNLLPEEKPPKRQSQTFFTELEETAKISERSRFVISVRNAFGYYIVVDKNHRSVPIVFCIRTCR